jgi:hypothetical protein
VVSALFVIVFHAWLVPVEIADSWWLLALYVFMFLNLEVVVAYWLAQRRSVEVMQYTLVVTVWRLATLLGRRCTSATSYMIFITIVIAETLKNVGIYAWLRARSLLTFHWDREALREQVRLVAPLGLGSILNKANEFGRVVGRHADGTRAHGYLHHGALPGAAGEHRADLAVGRDLPGPGQTRAERSG